jgi:FkbM family methyltransferase
MIKVIKINTEKLKLTKFGVKMLENPMGFFDIGSLGGIHPITESFSNYLNVVCFEPNELELEKIKKTYNINKYGKIIYSNKALFNKKGNKYLYLAKLETNSSLLKTSENFINRYKAKNFEIIGKQKIETTTIDYFTEDEEFKKENIKAEFIKIDTQGTEYQILEGAKKSLQEDTVAILCEVEFFTLYKNQKLFEDICKFLRKYGFKLYGLYPNYRSNQNLNKKNYEYEERLIWGDAVFLWDPIDDDYKVVNRRRVDALLMASIILGFYDYSLEINEKINNGDKKKLSEIIKNFAKQRRKYVDKRIKFIKSNKYTVKDSYKIIDQINFNRSYEK